MIDKKEAVRTEGLWKTYEHDGIEVHAVRDISLTINPGEFIALAGPSGSGKTTLLNLIGTLTRSTRGKIWIAGREVTDEPEGDLAQLRLRSIGFVFQAYNLLPILTAAENAELSLLLQGMDVSERRKRVTELFSRIGLEGLEDRRPNKLSGGQQQRVAVARAVVGQPAMVLADEPTANLDSQASDDLLDVMEELNRDLGVTFVFATHDPRVMERAHRLVHIVDGGVASDEVRERQEA
jgi:putative ABC transport system ATP-binding protein